MGRPVSVAIQARNDEIVAEYVNNLNCTIEDLHTKYGLSKVHIRVTLEKAQVPLRRESRKSFLERRSKDNTLVAMGARLDADRKNLGKSIAEYGLLIGMSEAKLGEALQGLHDWKFSELVRVTKHLGISHTEFMKPPRIHEVKNDGPSGVRGATVFRRGDGVTSSHV